jgi:hypothetical protein
MSETNPEYLLYGGEPSDCIFTYQLYLDQVQRGKSLLQLQAVAAAVTPAIRSAWSPRSFTPVITDEGTFDATVCNISYHFHKHGQKYGTVWSMTEAALRNYREHWMEGSLRQTDGLLRLPDGSLYEQDGRIVTFVS